MKRLVIGVLIGAVVCSAGFVLFDKDGALNLDAAIRSGGLVIEK